VLPLQYAAVWAGWFGVFAVLVPLLAFIALPIAGLLGGGGTQRYLERTSRLQWGLVTCVVCISHVPALATLPLSGQPGEAAQTSHPLLLIAFLVIVVQGSDVLQYIWGKLLGRRKVAPVLSPSKTWEGLVGGVASATAVGAALHWITPFKPLQAAGMAFVLCALGFLGGLVMSAIKRDRGVKDWGQLIQGHGGMLDRLDSLVFAAPVFFHVVRWYVSAQARPLRAPRRRGGSAASCRAGPASGLALLLGRRRGHRRGCGRRGRRGVAHAVQRQQRVDVAHEAIQVVGRHLAHNLQ
jgi:phosphatidate cytidylyltransferase